MKFTVLATALAASFAAPAFAGQSAAEIHALLAAEDDSNNYVAAVSGTNFSSKDQAAADAIFAGLFGEDETNNNGMVWGVDGNGATARAAQIHADLDAE